MKFKNNLTTLYIYIDLNLISKRNNRDENSNSKAKKTAISGHRSGSSIELHGVPLEYRLVMKDLEILKEAFDVYKMFI
jgi:hypothetical protein